MDQKDFSKRIQGAFDEASVGYDCPSMRFFDTSAENLAQSLSLKGHECVLDANTGTGKIAIALAQRLERGHITGIDFSKGMLREAAKKAVSASIKNTSFIQSDVETVNFPLGHFDGLTCGFGAHFWVDMEKSLLRLSKFIKKKGFIAITSFAKGSFEPHADLCIKLFEHYGVKPPKTYSLGRLDNFKKCTDLFKHIGLQNIVCTQMQAGYYLKSSQDWWDIVLFAGFRTLLNQLKKEQAASYKDKLLKKIDATKDRKGIYLSVNVITTVAMK